MSHNEKFFALAQHPFLLGIDSKLLEQLVSCAQQITVTPGQFLGRVRESANTFCLIQSGRVSIELQGRGGESVTLQTLGPGEVIGWSWFLPPHRWQFDARVVETVRVLNLDAERLRAMCEQDHELGYLIITRLFKVVVGRLTAARQRLLDAPG